MNIKGKALLAGCIALAFSNMALAEDIKVAVAPNNPSGAVYSADTLKRLAAILTAKQYRESTRPLRVRSRTQTNRACALRPAALGQATARHPR